MSGNHHNDRLREQVVDALGVSGGVPDNQPVWIDRQTEAGHEVVIRYSDTDGAVEEITFPTLAIQQTVQL